MPDPGTLWPSVFPNEGLGSLEKLTEAVTIPGAFRSPECDHHDRAVRNCS